MGFLGLGYQAHTRLPLPWQQLAACLILLLVFLFSIQTRRKA